MLNMKNSNINIWLPVTQLFFEKVCLVSSKNLLAFMAVLFSFSCAENSKAKYSDVFEEIENQYPIHVNISPDGKKILFKTRADKSFDLFSSEIETIEFDEIDRSNFTQLSLTWHPNGREIFFQEFNPTSGMYNIYKIDLDSKRKTLINLPVSNNAIPPLRWSANGKYMAYLATSNSSTLHIYDYERDEIKMSFPIIDVYSDFQWSNDTRILFVPNPERPILKIIDILTGELKENILIQDGEVAGDLSLQDDKVLFIGRSASEEFFQCYEISMVGGNTRKLTSSNFNVSHCKYTNEGNEFYFGQNENGINKLYCSDTQINKFLLNIAKNRGGLEINLEIENRLYVTNYSSSFPPVLLKLDVKNEKIETVYKPDDYLRPQVIRQPEFVEIAKKNSTLKIPGYFWESKLIKERVKTIVYIHGGPYAQVKPLWDVKNVIFNNYGFNVLSINYHGSSGYSKNFAESNSIPEQVTDVIAAVKFLNKEYHIDNRDIILLGFSYGGLLALKANDYLENIGGLVLISASVGRSAVNLEKLKKTKILCFYGEFDPLTSQAYHFFDENDLISSKAKTFKVLKNEGHTFHKSKSWVSIYSSIIESHSNFATKKE